MAAGDQSPLVEVHATRSGFLGAFAKTGIPAGTLVLSDPPLFTLDAPLQAYLFQRSLSATSFGPTPVEGESDDEEEPAKTLEDFLDRAIRRMLALKTDSQREQFWQLANTRESLPGAYGIFATNAVQTHGETGGLFLLLSRFNSSCRPTLSRPAWDPVTRTIKLFALRDIEAGEELTWTYLNVTFEFEGVESRRAEMKRVFEFECACGACGDRVGEDERRASEARLLELRRLKARIGGWEHEGLESEGRRRVLGRIAELARAEGLWETAQRLEKALEASKDDERAPE
ncbi:SPOSA6832_02202 [Sporobolomyces salmonicolor]|uniref:SPOSA6832_02202-mRNA-1:cds n=1 Tax=Sporidiobolus salmonicolor TaxID=5005 RepID=A0A0D6EKL2_SPOSA|nr:SPOSA6832_02202 [Sporobolomyces salmonicolor]